MLHLYMGEENLPKDIPVIWNVEAAIPLVVFSGTPFQREVLREVEHGEYYDSTRFVDRFGGLLYYTDMSTGSKAVMEVEAIKDRVINCNECGENALCMLSHLTEGHVFLSGRDIGLQWDIDCPIDCNGRVWERISLLNDFLE